MNRECHDIREALEEGGVLADPIRAHLEACPGCRRHAELLSVLATIPEPRSDEREVRRIMSTLPHPRWQLRRLWTWAPAVVGAAIAAVGVWLLGGVPASSAVPAATGGWTGVANQALAALVDTVSVARSAAAALSTVVTAGGPWVIAGLLMAGVGGGWLTWAVARRVREGRE